MTKRLKTLKDLGKCPDCKREDKEYRCVEMYYLREEAINWINSDVEIDQFTFMKFFDITEEDL